MASGLLLLSWAIHEEYTVSSSAWIKNGSLMGVSSHIHSEVWSVDIKLSRLIGAQKEGVLQGFLESYIAKVALLVEAGGQAAWLKKHGVI